MDLESVIDPSYFPDHELKLWELHLRALANHAQRPYGGRVTLFRTRGEPVFCSFAEDFRWGTLARDGVAVKRIPGSHESIFMPPHVEILAHELTAAIAETQTPEEVRANYGSVLP